MPAKRPPQVPGHPIIGNTLQFLRRDTLEFLTECARDTGDIAELQLAGKRAYVLAHPDAIQTVLVDDNQHYQEGGFQKMVAGSLLGNGLVLNEGESWRRQRRLLEDAFHPKYIQRYGAVITEHAEQYVDQWSDGDTIVLQEEMQRLTLNIITDALFDVDLREGSRASEFIDAFTQIMDHFTFIGNTYMYVPEWIPTPGNQRYNAALETLDEFIYDTIKERRRDGAEGHDVISLLLRAQQESPAEVTDKQIRDEVTTMLLAGHETTALALTYTLYLLAKYEDWTDAVREELQAEVGSESVTVGDVDALPVTERVLRESMRLYPPVYGIFREPTTDTVINGHAIPEGSMLILSQWVTQRDSRFYENPVTFDPGRWTDEFRTELHPGAYFPFAAGPRRCIGERFAMSEATIVLGTVLQNAGLELLSPAALNVTPTLTTHPSDPIQMRVSK